MTHEMDFPARMARDDRMAQFLHIVARLQPWATTRQVALRAGMARSWHVKGILEELVSMGYLDVEQGVVSNGWSAYYWSLTPMGEQYVGGE